MLQRRGRRLPSAPFRVSAQADRARESEVEQPRHQLRVRDAGRFPELRVHRRRREAWHRVDLVEDDVPVREHERVDARETLATERDESPYGQVTYAPDDVIGKVGGDHEADRLIREVLGGEVVELSLCVHVDLPRERCGRRPVERAQYGTCLLYTSDAADEEE